MNISRNGLDLLKDFEGFRGVAYLCPAGVWTIGYGTTRIKGKPVKECDTCTKDEAFKYLANDCKKFAKFVNNCVTVPLTQNMFDALCCFAYNLGSLGEDMAVLINNKEYLKAADQFDLFVNVTIHENGEKKKKKLTGLEKRRAKEKALFLKDMYIKPDKEVTRAIASTLETMWIQDKLGITIDGIWGKQTAAAIIAARTKRGWKPGNGYICTKNLIDSLS